MVYYNWIAPGLIYYDFIEIKKANEPERDYSRSGGRSYSEFSNSLAIGVGVAGLVAVSLIFGFGAGKYKELPISDTKLLLN